jgi:DNA-binding beta-propeller fold protein YncE
MIKAILTLALTMTMLNGEALAADQPLTLEKKIPLGAVSGRIDHLAIDPARGRLFVAELGNGSVGVVDLNAGAVIHRIAGLKEPQGVGYAASSDTLFVASAGDGTVRLYRGADLSPAGRVDLGEDADNIRVDEARRRVWIGYGDGALAALDAASGAKLSTISLKAHPESFQLAPSDARIFANVPDAGQIAIIDAAAAKQVSAIETRSARANFPMALDPDGGRILVAFRRPPQLIAYATSDGHAVARTALCDDADDVFFDAKRQRAYVSCGAGAVDIFELRGESLERIGHVATVSGARTALFAPERDRLYVGVRASGGEPAAIWVFRPTP